MTKVTTSESSCHHVLSYGVLHIMSQEGDSAVMLAAWRGKTGIVVELVKAGANLDLQDNV